LSREEHQTRASVSRPRARASDCSALGVGVCSVAPTLTETKARAGAEIDGGRMTEHHNGHDAPIGGALRTEDVTRALEKPEYRLDGPYKVSGRARYVGDVQLPGTLFAKFLLSPHPHARIVSIDTSAAKAVPGVHAILTGRDIGPRLFGRVLYDWPVLAYDRVRYVGERVAAVAAETRDAAEEAVGRIQVEYEELPAIFDPEEALQPDRR